MNAKSLGPNEQPSPLRAKQVRWDNQRMAARQIIEATRELTADLVFQDFEAIIVSSEWGGSGKIIAIPLDRIEADAGSAMSGEEALDFVRANSDHYLELARVIDETPPISPPFSVEIEPEGPDEDLLHSARRRLQERLAARGAPDAAVAKIHNERSELHAHRMRQRR